MSSYREIIQQNFVYLSENVSNLVVVLAHLFEKNIISESEKEIIKGKPTTFEQGNELFTTLLRKDLDLRWNSTISPILRKTGNDRLAEKIKDSIPKNVPLQNVKVQGPSQKKTTDTVVNDSDISVDPFGELNSLCTKLKYKLPEYSEIQDGSCFRCICTINGKNESETATTKKQAKRRVAHKWLMILKSQNPDVAKK